VGPLHAGRRASLVGELVGARTGDQEDLAIGADELLHGERCPGAAIIGDRWDAVEPFAPERSRQIRFVLIIGLQDLDRLTVDPPNSSAAMRAASIDPCPVAVANTPFISVSTHGPALDFGVRGRCVIQDDVQQGAAHLGISVVAINLSLRSLFRKKLTRSRVLRATSRPISYLPALSAVDLADLGLTLIKLSSAAAAISTTMPPTLIASCIASSSEVLSSAIWPASASRTPRQ
jgi:hypothetical protein